MECQGYEVVGDIFNVDTIASGAGVRIRDHLNEVYGRGRWRKLKGDAYLGTARGVRLAELHWFEAHGIGRRDCKIKRWLD